MLRSGRNHQKTRSSNGRFLRHRFSPKPTSVATPNSLPKRNRVAKEAVSAARQTKIRHRSGRIGKPYDAPRTKPWPCVKTMLCESVVAKEYDDGNTVVAFPVLCKVTVSISEIVEVEFVRVGDVPPPFISHLSVVFVR